MLNLHPKYFFILLLSAFLIAAGAQPTQAADLVNKLKGKILLQVEAKGEAWYVNPQDGQRYYLANGAEAYKIMRQLGIGINTSNLNKFKSNKKLASQQQGKIFLQVDSHGEAYYIDGDGLAHYLKDGEAAYQIMRQLGLGIKNTDLAKIPLSAQTTKTTSTADLYSVVDVVDGDTIKLNINGKTETVRLIGVDTPETVDTRKLVQCFGQEASNKTKELMLNQRVRLETDASQGVLDKYQRRLVYVFREDGLFLNQYLIEQGYAHEYTYHIPYKYQADFKASQKAAQTNLRGLWAANACAQASTTTASSTSPSSTPVIKSAGKYYTSTYSTAKYYYPDNCEGWKSLKPEYLKSFDSLEALLKIYPNRIISPSCQ